MKHNILITSAGQRVALVKDFQETLQKFFPDGKVYTTDMNPRLAPAAYVSDGCFEVPRCTSEDSIESLLTICLGNKIGLIVPTIDTELAILSANKEIFAKQGITASVSDYDFVMMCRDKRNTGEFFEKHGINMAAQYLQTSEAIGYVVMDILPGDPHDLLPELRAIPGTLKCRVLY